MNRALQIRLDRGLSRAAVCGGAGITAKALRKIEDSEQDGTHAATLKALGDFYGVPASSLLLEAVQDVPA